MSAKGLGCVKTRMSQRCAELFSQLHSPERGRQYNLFFTSTKSKQNFYTQVQLLSFHAARVKTGKAQREHMFSAMALITDVSQCRRHVRRVPQGDMHGRKSACSRDYGMLQYRTEGTPTGFAVESNSS